MALPAKLPALLFCVSQPSSRQSIHTARVHAMKFKLIATRRPAKVIRSEKDSLSSGPKA